MAVQSWPDTELQVTMHSTSVNPSSVHSNCGTKENSSGKKAESKGPTPVDLHGEESEGGRASASNQSKAPAPADPHGEDWRLALHNVGSGNSGAASAHSKSSGRSGAPSSPSAGKGAASGADISESELELYVSRLIAAATEQVMRDPGLIQDREAGEGGGASGGGPAAHIHTAGAASGPDVSETDGALSHSQPKDRKKVMWSDTPPTPAL